uniref:Uncharacterized protein n=1 Tax=Arundo donax TaxID=35708 RepID=A0A0A9D0C6_ARUDO
MTPESRLYPCELSIPRSTALVITIERDPVNNILLEGSQSLIHWRPSLVLAYDSNFVKSKRK